MAKKQKAVTPQPTDTIKAGQDYVYESMQEAGGGTCPCCSQTVKLYKRGLNGPMAVMLILLHKMNDGTHWTYVGDWRKAAAVKFDNNMDFGGGDYGKLLYWGLVEKQPLQPGMNNKSSGQWKMTPKGRDFVLGRTDLDKVPSHALVYNGEVVGFSDTEVTIQECLGTRFDYSELMEATRAP